MARNFDTNTDDLNVASPSVSPSADGTIAFWFNPAWSSGDSVNHYLCNFITGGTAELHLVKADDNNMYAGWIKFSPLDNDRIVVADTGLFTSGTWAHWAFRWSDSADTCELFKNGTSVASRTSALATHVVNTNAIIGNAEATTSVGAMGTMQEFALYSASLSNDEITALAKRFSPMLVRPSALELYLPMHNGAANERNICGTDSYTANGTVDTDHTPMIYPAPPMYPTFTAVAPPAPTYSPSNIIWF